MGFLQYPILFALVSLSFLQGAQGRPKSHVQLSIDHRNHSIGIRNATEKPQRLCLARLIDALQIACSGSERTPVYFDPNQVLNLTQGSSRVGSSANPTSKNFRNDISIMSSANQPRRLLRRRSRRNIVRECCYKACSPHNLMKYCSSSIRFSSTFRGNSPVNKKQLLLGGHGNIKERLTNSQYQYVQDDSRFISTNGLSTNHNNATDDSDDDDKKAFTKTAWSNNPSNFQCVTVADLQNFYETIVLQGNWKKDANAGASWDNSNFQKMNLPVDDFHAVNAYAVATNEMHPNLKEFLNQIISLKHGNFPISSQSTPAPTETTSTTEEIINDNEDDNNVLEFEEVTEEDKSTKPRYNSNIQTLKPVIFISLPKGTNDYFY